MNPTRNPLATAALIFSGLGWITFGLLAIPGVIFAHVAKREGGSDATTAKAALVAGYSAIAAWFAVPVCALLLGAGFLVVPTPGTQNVPEIVRMQGVIEGNSTPSDPVESTPWLLWLGVAAAIIGISAALPLLARLLRSLNSRHQVRHCVARNRAR